ncbi:hypothetical protein EXN66_Car014687 [Channa argus]|uniref:Uncharacterized protein n=1 Tax=Channa argus TaxID=215402 RepID=A0A6G1Q8M0_CHAAH|nr:hypothetical protein EXN66_Car014687 [Channa argus]KAK2895653.1 hypothetical protein Q8A73_015141 [Channa argus]
MAWSLVSTTVQYYKLFKYSLKWISPMYTRRSSRQPKGPKKSPERNPSPDEDVIQRKFKGKRQGTALRKSKGADGIENTDGRNCDIIEFIDTTHEAELVVEEDEGRFVEVADKGVDESDEDCVSVTSSIASGPSLSYHSTSSQVRCSACQKLYQKARRMKATTKNKLLDNDPDSLTCDQWALIKKWKPRRLPKARGKLVILIQLVNKRLKVMKGVKQSQQHVGESSSCSRPHIFLRRNLSRCVKVPMKQEKKTNTRRKRTRNDSQGSRAAKQRRLHSTTYLQHLSATCKDVRSHHGASSHSSRSGFEDCSDKEIDRCLTSDLVPSTVPMENTGSAEVPPTEKTLKKASGFRDLLAQLRGNSSIIIRETH